MAAHATRSPRYLGKITALLVTRHVVAGTSYALHAARDRRRRLDLYHQIHRAHIDAKFKRRGGNDAAQGAELQAIFNFLALPDRNAPVMSADK